MKSLLTVLFAIFFSTPCLAQVVQVFTDQAHPVVNAGTASVVFLDAPAQIEEQMSQGLSADPYVAEKQIRTRINSPEWKALQNRLNTAYTGVVNAWHLGITKIPAVVVDDKYVVYGESDVLQAMQKISIYRKAH